MSNGISVVICAHNSAERLPPTIQALARCKAEFPVEIILVDNDSSDDTAERAKAAWTDCGNVCFAFTIIWEPQPGLSYARRAGTRAASFDVILFCDDDNWLAEDYLINAVRIMQDPTIGAAGGCSTPANPDGLPPWFYTFSWGFAVGVPISRIARLPDAPETERQVDALWGAGLVTRRDLIAFLYTLPGFPMLSGRKGEKLLSGEDIEISACVACAGYKLIFSERLRFKHAITPSRLTTAYAKRLFASFEEGFAVTGQYTKIIAAFESPGRAAAVSCARIFKHVLLRRLTRESFLSLLAALRLPGLMTSDQKQIYRTVESVRAHGSVPHKSVRPALRNVVSENPA
ncbi:glycosyltransferase [Hyphomicrobium sp. ghe19]|uniref:glycosyltransferase n=1 Tax=Hyphomicrobium sp. ghe19 TaxID=2682968 RepID=UPI0013677B8E|nr:hypothetical protein HYPP_03284 [Hyphomicrobium sp. ghe19]